MRGRGLRDGSAGESPVNAVDIFFSDAPQIVEGGCCSPDWGSSNFKSRPNLQPAPRRWIAVAALALIVIVAFGLLRYFSRR
jgi:hypothetical protein